MQLKTTKIVIYRCTCYLSRIFSVFVSIDNSEEMRLDKKTIRKFSSIDLWNYCFFFSDELKKKHDEEILFKTIQKNILHHIHVRVSNELVKRHNSM